MTSQPLPLNSTDRPINWQPGRSIVLSLARYRSHAGLIAVLLVTAAIGLLTLLRAPEPDVDEAWNANRVWALIQTGHAFGTMDAGVFERHEGYWAYFPWLGTWLHTFAIHALGPTLQAVRLTSLAFGLALLVAVYATGSSLGGRHLGLLAAALLAGSHSFVYSSHLGRHDVIVAAMGFGAIALFLAERSSELPWRSLLAGLLVGLTLDVHLNGLLYVPVLGLLCLHASGWSLSCLVRDRRLWAVVAGGSAGVLFFVIMHIVPNPATYFALGEMGPASARMPPMLTLDPGVWLQSLGDTGILLAVAMSPFAIPLIVLPLLARRGRMIGDSRLLIISLGLFMTLAALVRVKFLYYAILVTPAAALLAAAFLDSLWNEIERIRRRNDIASRLSIGIVTAVVGGLLLASGLHSFSPLAADPMPDTRATFERVRQVIPAGSTVMGPQTYWFALPPDQRYLSWEQILYYASDRPGSTLEDALVALRPDYLVLDSRMGGYIVDEPETLPLRFRHLYISKADLGHFLLTRGQLVMTEETKTFGEVQIYRLVW